MADVEMSDAADIRKKGRGFGQTDEKNGQSANGGYESLSSAETSGNAARSVEGWIIICTGVHDEASEEDLTDLFADFGKVMNLHLNLDRRTGYVKGYALIEYATKAEAEAAIKGTNGTEFLEQTIYTDFAFTKAPAGAAAMGRGPRGPPAGGARRQRSRSPQERV